MDSKKSIIHNIEWNIHNFTRELAIDGNSTTTSTLEISYGEKVIKGRFNGFIEDNRFFVDPVGDFASECMIKRYSIKLHSHKWKKIFFVEKSILLNTIFTNPHFFLEDNTLTILIEAEFIDGLASVVSESNHNPLFRNFFNDKSFNDFMICCSDGEKIPTHRFVLAATSPVLKQILKNKCHFIKFYDINGITMWSILRYIYTDEILDMEDNIADLLYGAEKFGLEGLKSRCAKFMVNYLSVHNVIDYFILADNFDMKWTLNRCARFINTNHEAVVANKNWKKLNKRQITMLLGFYHENLEKVFYFESSLVKTEQKEVNNQSDEKKEESKGTKKKLEEIKTFRVPDYVRIGNVGGYGW